MFDTTEVEEQIDPWAGLPVVIDADEIAYVAASGNEVRGIRAKSKTPFAPWKEYTNRTEFYSEVGKKNKDDYIVEDVQYPFSIDKCYKKVDDMIESIMDRCRSTEYKLFMGSGSPRDDIATVEVYKGQRGNMIRPVQLKEARQYCIDMWGAVEVDGTKHEADDMLAIWTTKKGCISASQDKDAYQVAGWLLKPAWSEPRLMDAFGYFDVDKSGKTPIAVGQGECFLAYQCTVGDSSDNYKPTKLTKKTFGMAGAKKLIDLCTNREELWTAVTNKYKEWYPEPVKYKHAYTGEDMVGTWHSLFNEYYRLAYMMRDEDDCRSGYDLMDELGISYED